VHKIFIINAISSTYLPIGPIRQGIHSALAVNVLHSNLCKIGILFEVGFIPITPQKQLGFLIEPPKSLPIPTGEQPRATRPASPPDDPPVVLSIFQGFFALPKILFMLS